MTDIKYINNVEFIPPPTRLTSLVGRQFELLFVVSYLGYRGRRPVWLCYCECGQWTSIIGENLRSGNSTNCGCRRTQRLAESRRTHGLANRLPEYNIWKSIRGRCNNPTDQAFYRYGGRGITVCERWDDFANFLADMGHRPTSQHSLDRINNDLGYCPENCKWATVSEQNNNKRSNRPITFRGRTENLVYWVNELHISKNIFYRGLLLGKTEAESLAYALERKGKHDSALPPSVLAKGR